MKILELGEPLRRRDIARRLHTSIRTVYRDLKLLREMNVPLRNVDDYYSLDKRAWRKWSNQTIGLAIRKCGK